MISEVSALPELDGELARACEEAWSAARAHARATTDERLLSVVVPLSGADASDMLRDASLGELWSWDARAFGDRTWVTARGVAAALDVGPVVEKEVDALLASVVEVPANSPAWAPPPRVFCALPFDGEDRRVSPWGALARGTVSLPRWTLSDDGTRRALRLIASREELLRPIARSQTATRPRGARVVGRRNFDAEYLARVGLALDALTGDVTKLVAAREIELTLERPVAIEHAVSSLARTTGLTRFAVERGGVAFVGATPEQLVRRTGQRVESEAVAGTRRANDGGGLSGSEKDRREQEIVRDAIVGTFRALGASVSPCAAASERPAGNVVHLTTKVTATMQTPPSALALARALSPTPAVCGFPREPALAWLRAHEPPRGLYAGPVGWVEAGGDGHFVVGIRSMLLTNGAAHAYVGAGIVRGSMPAAELEETRWKAETLLGLLGMDG